MRRHIERTAPALACAGLVVAFLFSSAPARAQGFGLYEQGACMMGRAGAGVAAPCDDGSGAFFNPAGLALDKGTVISAGITGIAPRGTFTDSTTKTVSALNTSTFPVPSVYFATHAGSRAVVGIGLFAPYGLTSDWSTTSEGRFLGYKSSIKSIYVQPTFAARVSEQVYVGAGLDITHTSLELHRRVDLSTLAIPGAPAGFSFGALGVPAGSDFADVGLNGSGTHVGGHVGVIIKASDKFSIGGRYLFRQTVAIDNGTVATTQIPTGLTLRAPLPGLPVGTPLDLVVKSAFAPGGPLSAQTATTSLPLPDQLVLGVAVRATPKLKLLADYQYTHWSLFNQVAIAYQFAPQTVLVESYRDTHGVRIGAEYAIGRAMVRGGVDGHTAGAPDQSVTPLLPEAPRTEYAAGVTLPFSGNVRLDLAYMYVNQSDRNGRTTDGGLAVPTVAVNNGIYHYYANLYSASIVIHF